HTFGAPEVLTIEDVQLRELEPGEVRIAVQSIGVNRAEVNFRLNQYLDKAARLPSGLGYEGTGVVRAVAPDVDDVAVGDEVCVLPVFPQSKYHLYAEEAIVPARALVPRPTGVSVIH